MVEPGLGGAPVMALVLTIFRRSGGPSRRGATRGGKLTTVPGSITAAQVFLMRKCYEKRILKPCVAPLYKSMCSVTPQAGGSRTEGVA